MPISGGFWTLWIPNSISPRWPACWWVLNVIDHFSRWSVGCGVFRSRPTSAEVTAALDRIMSAEQMRPKHLIVDQGSEFKCEHFEHVWCKALDILPRFGAVGKHGSIAVVERFHRTLKELLRLSTIPEIVHKDKAYPGEHSAIVKADLFEKVQEVLRANKTYTHRHQVRRSALLRGLLRCGECGSLIQPAWTTNHGREYRYYACSRRVKTGYGKCGLPTLPAGEIETVVVDQFRALLRHPDVIARTYREIQERSSSGPSQEATEQLEQLCQRREQLRESIRVLLGLAKQNEFMSDELKRLNGELNALDRSIGQLERNRVSTDVVELSGVTDALQRIDPVWEVLHPDEQRRVLELLVEKVTVSKERVDVRFRANGIEQVAGELGPNGARSND